MIDFTNAVSAPVGATITLYGSPFTVTRAVEATVVNSYYQIVDYRWRKRDVDNQPWAPSSQGNPFQFSVDEFYQLAVRVRVSPLAALFGVDWWLEFSTNPAANLWTRVAGSEDIAIGESPLDVSDIPAGAEWPIARWVTNPGPGGVATVPGSVAYDEDHSTRFTGGLNYYVEVEILFRIYIGATAPEVPYYFRLASTNESTTIRPFSPILSQPWITQFT
jgi:hypothetical protein